MIIGSLLPFRFKDINNQVILYCIFSIIEVISICGGITTCFIMISSMYDNVIEVKYFIILIAIIFDVAAFIFYFKTLSGGVRIMRIRKYKKWMSNDSIILKAEHFSIKKESHCPSKFANDLYYRYYIECIWGDNKGIQHKYKSEYFYKSLIEYFSQQQNIIIVDRHDYNKGYIKLPDIQYI